MKRRWKWLIFRGLSPFFTFFQVFFTPFFIHSMFICRWLHILHPAGGANLLFESEIRSFAGRRPELGHGSRRIPIRNKIMIERRLRRRNSPEEGILGLKQGGIAGMMVF
jgi:hypothetical protein